ncbi:hypothetical protein MAM1_0001d00066 [Mucor ambiguus]|uniref:Uncharacterized protein n=1 Tax=Mucor ambiguus TaxID=91626 RepID=A0A0C9M3K0_9FUNG|nr:hypothetical protein MAM1_0001d00066 [Mucor ambiguus]
MIGSNMETDRATSLFTRNPPFFHFSNFHDLAAASIETAITAFKNFTNPNQVTISSAIEKRLTNFETILEKILQAIDHLMTLHAPTDQPVPPLQDTPPQASSTSHLPSNDTAVKPTTTRTWADITSRPPAPLTDRRRQALHRIFTSKDEESPDANSYTFVYHLSRTTHYWHTNS